MDKGHKNTEKILKELEAELKQLYYAAFKENKVKLDKVNNIISEYTKDLTEQERLKIWNRKERLEKILNNLTDEIKNTNITATNMINNKMVNVYSENFNYAAYLVENASGIDCGFNIYNKNAIKKLLADNINPFSKISLDELRNKDFIYRMLKRNFTVAIVNGESIKDIANRVQQVLDKTLSDSIRIARTETTRIESLGRQDAFEYGEKQGLKLGKMWISTVDNRTRERHLNLQGEVVGLHDKFSNGLEYPGALGGKASEVINCRCTHVAEFLGLEKTAAEKELDEKLKSMSYNEWLNRG